MAGTHDVVERFPIAVGPATSKEFNAVTTALMPVACWRVDDIRFRFGSSFVEPEVAREIAALKNLRQQHKLHVVGEGVETGADIFPRISIFGHADPTGDDEYNKQLSGRRAAAIYGMLTRRDEVWEDLYSNKGAFAGPAAGDKWGNAIDPNHADRIRISRRMTETVKPDPDTHQRRSLFPIFARTVPGRQPRPADSQKTVPGLHGQAMRSRLQAGPRR